MRISTRETYTNGVGALLDQQARVSETQVKIASGTRITRPSDDPIGNSIALNLKQQVNAAEQFIKNGQVAENVLKSQEAAMVNISDILGRVRELTLQAGSGALSVADRKSLAVEMQGRLDELVSIANTQTPDGTYLFSGFTNNNKPFTKDNAGNFQYNGDQGSIMYQVNTSVTVKGADNGAELFMTIPTGNGSFETREGTSNAGSGVIAPAVVSDFGTFVPDTYSISFFTDGTGALRYSVSGATQGQVVPAPPLTIATDSPAFVEGADITFNGIKAQIQGRPSNGDSFSVAPSNTQNIFKTVEDAVKAMGLPADSAGALAHLQNQLSRVLQNLDQALTRVDGVRASIGTRANVIESERAINESLVDQANAALSAVKDLDYADAITQLNRQSTALQAAQQSFVKIQSLNIFQYI
jgi:flagellar hook-associated protein 3 FlgL